MRKTSNDRLASAKTPVRPEHSRGTSGKLQPQRPSASLGTSEEEGADRAAHAPERTCILSRRPGSRDELIRLALSPHGEVLPDVRAKAPGRGAWVGVPRRELDAANAKGKLKGALSRAFKTGDLQVPADLGEKIEAALRQAALDRLGLEARGGTLINGSDRVETAARSGKVHLLLHALDAGDDGRRRLDQAWRVGGSDDRGYSRGLVFPVERTILSMALGRENVVHVALIDPAAAARVSRALGRWHAFIDPDPGLSGGNSGTGDAALGPGSADLRYEGTQ